MILIFILMMTGVSLRLNADETQCRSVLQDCDTAVQALQKETALQKQIIADEDDRFNTQTKELRAEQFWKPVALGALSAAIIEGLILSFKK
jgi:hypothetical protein